MNPKPGDMFCIRFPFEDDLFGSKPRPVIILRDDGNGKFLVAPVTGTNLTGKRIGLWISKDSDEGIQMNLEKDSFIVMDKAMQYPSFGFIEYWGFCPIVEELLKKIPNPSQKKRNN